MIGKIASLLALLFALSPVLADTLDGAKADLAAGRWRAAEVALKGLLQQDPKRADARRLLGELYLARRDGAAAEHAMLSAVPHGQPGDQILAPLGLALLYQGQAKRVLDEIQVPVGAAPALEAELLALRGFALGETGDMDGAERAFGRSLELDPQGLRPRLGLARLAAAEGDLAQAKRLAVEALQIDRRSLEAWELLAELEGRDGHGELAVQALDEALKLAPESLALYQMRGQLRLDQGDADGAELDLKALEAQLGASPALGLLRGRLAIVRLRDREGIAELERYLAVRPSDPLALYLAGAATYRLGQIAQAQEYAERLRTLTPGSVRAEALLAAVLLAKGDAPGADALLAKLPAVGVPPMVEVLRLRVAVAQGRTDEALKLLDGRIASAVDPWEDRMLRLRLLAAKGDWTSVAREAAELIAIDPQRPGPGDLLIDALLRTGDTAGAVAQARDRVSHIPRDPKGHNALGAALGRSGDPDGAREAFLQALKLDPRNELAALNLARLEAAGGDLAAARAPLDRLAAAAPEDATAVLALASLDLHEGRAAQAGDRLRVALDRKPGDVALRLNLAAALNRQGDVQGALRALQDAPAALADSPPLMRARGELELAAGQPAQAVATFERLRGLKPDAADPALLLARARAEAGQLQDLERPLVEGLTLDGRSALIAETLAAVVQRLPDAEARTRMLESVGRVVPSHPAYLTLAAELALARQDTEGALKYLKAARDGAPDSPQVHRRMSALLVAAGRVEEGRSLVADWVERHPKDVAERLTLAGLDLRLGREPAAIEQYRAIVELDPSQRDALNNLAMLTMEQDLDQSLALARRAAAIDPPDWRVVDTLALVLLRKGLPGEAVEALGPALGANPGNPTLRYRLADALVQTGDRDRALRLLMELGEGPFPEREQAAGLLARLREGADPRP